MYTIGSSFVLSSSSISEFTGVLKSMSFIPLLNSFIPNEYFNKNSVLDNVVMSARL